MSDQRIIAWVDGANSAVMGKLMLAEFPSLIPVHCDLGDSVDSDSHRFIADVEAWYGRDIIRISSSEYLNIDEVFEDKKFHSNKRGAPCTGAMKRVPRIEFQQPGDIHLFGYTCDARDVERHHKFVAKSPGLLVRSPLIDRGITKVSCHALLEKARIKRPRVYDLGFPNGNCIGCVKASSPAYWALVRKHFPEVFARRADQCRRFGSKLVIVGQKKGPDGQRQNIRAFIDEIPLNQSTKGAIVPACDFMCQLAEMDSDLSHG